MKKIYFFLIALSVSLTIGAQSIQIDISKMNSKFTKTIDGSLVLDVATAVSKMASPAIYYPNPFKGKAIDSVGISFDAYNYQIIDSTHALGALFGIHGVLNDTATRLYFSNGTYLGYNETIAPTASFFDANLLSYGVDSPFLASKVWKHVDLKFWPTGYAMYIDGKFAYNQSSTDVTITTTIGTIGDYGRVIKFFTVADSLTFGTGSWWSDNTRADGSYYDNQYTYLKNIQFRPNISALINGVSQVISAGSGKLINEVYFNINGVNLGNNFRSLRPGVYIKRSLYSDGTIKSTKMVKVVQQ